jgi:hypothetical protein
MKRLGPFGTGLLVLTALMAATGAVPAGASHPQSHCIDAGADNSTHISNDGETDVVEVARGTSDADHPPDSECHVEDGGGGAIEIDFEVTGTADPDDSDSPESPDLTCTIEADRSSCSVTPPVAGGGSQQIAAWVDSDLNSETVELDLAEAPDESESPGDVGEPDNSDVVAWRWTHYEVHPDHTTIRYERKTGSFRGSIGSPRKRCQVGRTVTVKRSKERRDVVLKSDITNRSGKWRVTGFPSVRGRFSAVGRPKVFTDHAGNEVRCPRAFSPTIRVR